MPGGRILIVHFDWLPLPGSVAAVTEALIQDWNPKWTLGGGDGLYPQWSEHLKAAGATDVDSFHFDVAQPFTHDAWYGRIRASAGVGGSMDEKVQRRFETELQEVLEFQFPEDLLVVPHRIFAISGRMPS